MTISKRLVDKSVEAFIMGLEIYNKPTIRYRVEGFAFFICNAWELMLKAKIINDEGEEAIYFKDKTDRTIDLSKAIKLIFTNDKDPLRINLENIISLRNVSTHFITDDYERVYAPLFQACVANYSTKLLEYHNKDITDEIPQNFLTLSLNLTDSSDNEIRAKYSPEIAERFIIQRNNLSVCEQQINNPKFSISFEQKLYITKKKKEAQFLIAVDRDANAKGTIIKEMRDPKNTHNFSFGILLKTINQCLIDRKITFEYIPKNGNKRTNITSNDLTLFIKFYSMKENKIFTYEHRIGKTPQYSYSLEAVNFIVSEIKKDPKGVITNLKNAIKQNKKG